MFKCRYCKKEFDEEKLLKKHYGQCKNRRIYISSILTKEFLTQEYEIKNKTANIIAKELNKNFNLEITAGTIIKCLIKFGIKRKTMAETYTPERIERQKKTNLEKFGVENVFCKDSPVRKKFEEVWEKNGYINPFSREDVKEKIKQTCLRKYGVEYSRTIKTKIRKYTKI